MRRADSPARGGPGVTSPLLHRPGAVAGVPPDEGVAAHYGDPLREQRPLATAAGLVDRSNRDMVLVNGPDRLSWLHSITSQSLATLSPYVVTEALVLSAHGHVEHHLTVVDDGERTWLGTEPGAAPALMDYLRSMRFLLRVEPVDASGTWAVLSVIGPRATDLVRDRLAVDLTSGEAAAASIPTGGLAYRTPWPGTPGVDLVLPRDRISELVDRIDLPVAGLDSYEALRVAARRPRLGFETDHRTIPHEVGWIGSAVHLDKGCYRGQETVARVHNLGRPPRRLVFLDLDGGAERLPARGSALVAGDRTVGRVGTAVRHFELGPVALGLVRYATPDDVELTADGVAARLEPVVRHEPVVTSRRGASAVRR